MSTTESGYRSLIHDISQDLSGEDARGLRFLAGLPSMRCQCGAGGGQLGLLQALQERGMCSQFNLNTLISLLREIGRHDLASKCQQFVPGGEFNTYTLNSLVQAVRACRVTMKGKGVAVASLALLPSK